LILSRLKTLEIRTWNTNFRGEFYLHASQNLIPRLMSKFELKKEDLPSGCLVGKAELVDVIKFENKDHFASMEHKHLVNAIDWFQEGRTYGFVLENPTRLEKPIKFPGKLNFFNVDQLKPQKILLDKNDEN